MIMRTYRGKNGRSEATPCMGWTKGWIEAIAKPEHRLPKWSEGWEERSDDHLLLQHND